jgi:predicted secreted protein with PEFG-CTERM motif
MQTDTEEVISNNQTRMLSIDFEKGVEQIEIAGTRIIPEFGSEISMLLLSVSIIGILAFTNKYRKFRLPFV